MSSEVFCDFLGALGGFQSFVTETAAAARRGAQFAPALLNNIIKEFESRTLVESGAPVVHTLRASLYKLRGDLDQAIATLEQARELAPGDLFVAENLPKWREERMARIEERQAELAAPPVAGAPGIQPAVLATNYEAVRNQDALQQVAYPALIRAAAGDRAAPIVVAILSTGYTPGVEPPGPAATIRPVMNLVAGEGPEDGNGHGTTVTNLMAALIPFAEVELLPVKVLGASGGGQLTDIQAGFDRSVELGARIIVAPLGVRGRQPLVDRSVEVAEAAGLTIAAAGNDGRESEVGSPAAVDAAIAVGAVQRDGDYAAFSPGPQGVDVFVPGIEIVTVDARGDVVQFSGTSYSAALAAALVTTALAPRPDLSNEQIRAALAPSSEPAKATGRRSCAPISCGGR
jgi:hypothetical protein